MWQCGGGVGTSDRAAGAVEPLVCRGQRVADGSGVSLPGTAVVLRRCAEGDADAPDPLRPHAGTAPDELVQVHPHLLVVIHHFLLLLLFLPLACLCPRTAAAAAVFAAVIPAPNILYLSDKRRRRHACTE